MIKCYSDINGNMPCDNGCLCDKCLHEDVEKVIFPEYWGCEEEEVSMYKESAYNELGLIARPDVTVKMYIKMLKREDGGEDVFIVEVMETETEYEAWIRLQSYGVSMLMFGSPKVQPAFGEVSYDDFISLVESNIQEYAELYIDEYGEE